MPPLRVLIPRASFWKNGKSSFQRIVDLGRRGGIRLNVYSKSAVAQIFQYCQPLPPCSSLFAIRFDYTLDYKEISCFE